MSHEMIRSEAEAAGYDTTNLPATIAGVTRDDDIVDVWEQLPLATDFEPKPLDPDEPLDGSTQVLDDGEYDS